MANKLNATMLFAGSSGNALYVKYNDTEFLIDAGVSAKAICNQLNLIGSDMSQIKAIFVTHEHIDHVKGLAVLSKKYGTPIHMTSKSAQQYFKKNPQMNNVFIHDCVYSHSLGDVSITSFKTSHDSAECVGYVMRVDDDSLAIATDLGYVSKEVLNALNGCNSIILESNYDEEMLKNGSYPLQLKDRIRSPKGHLSNYDCAALAVYLAQRGTKNFMLSHLSDENNTPEIAFNVASRALAEFDVKLSVAERKTPTVFI